MKNNFLLLLVLLVTVAAALGIMKGGSTVKGLGISPEIVSFTATPAVVRPGEPVTLAWETRGTVSVAMEWGTRRILPSAPSCSWPRGCAPSSGTMTVQPKEETVYELRCYTVAGPMCLPASTTVRTK